MSSTPEEKIPKVSGGVSKKKPLKRNYKKELKTLQKSIHNHLELNCLTGKLMCLFMTLHETEVKHVTNCIEEFRATLTKAVTEAWMLFKHSTQAEQCHQCFLEILQTPPLPFKEVNEVIEVIEITDQSGGYEADTEDTCSNQNQSQPYSPESPTRYFLPEIYKDTQQSEQSSIAIKQEQQ